VVISPLIALMQDQVAQLSQMAIPAAFLNSSVTETERSTIKKKALAGEYRLMYISPERAVMDGTADWLKNVPVSFFAIDEAHCISEWGHDFRPEYRQLSKLRELFPQRPIAAFTASATQRVRHDIVEQLKLRDPFCAVLSFRRENLRYLVKFCQGGMQNELLLNAVKAAATGNVIVYAPTVARVGEVVDLLGEQGIAAVEYHGQMSSQARRENQERWMTEEVRILVGTIAFGLGINKANVRAVIRLGLPDSIEQLYQETGRAGRDGAPADAWMAYGLADVVNQRRMIDDSVAGEDFKRIQRGKLDALLALAESHDCRRVRLLGYFGEAYAGATCGNCDNCINPPRTWDATEAARKALSCIYRFRQHGGIGFGAGHLIDVLRGKHTDKTAQHGHEALSTFGVGAELSEAQWRSVLRQLLALGYAHAEGEFNTLQLAPSARALLKGDQQVVDLLFGKIFPGKRQLNDWHGRSVVRQNKRRSRAWRILPQLRLCDGRNLRHGHFNMHVGIEEYFDDAEAVQGLRFYVLDVVDCGGEPAFIVDHQPLGNILSGKSRIPVHDAEDGDIDVRKNIDGRGVYRQHSENQDEQRHHHKGIWSSQR
jgi:ATP-dependent DNA helicase RecQ